MLRLSQAASRILYVRPFGCKVLSISGYWSVFPVPGIGLLRASVFTQHYVTPDHRICL